MHSPSRPRTAVVTGTNRGTGRAIGQALTRANYEVVSINRTAAPDNAGIEFLCDLADSNELSAVLGRLRETFDRLDLVVLNAATRVRRRIAEAAPADWAASLLANVAAPAIIVAELLPLLRSSSGLVILIGSHAADRFFEGGSLYS